jgi:hypothetical protein
MPTAEKSSPTPKLHAARLLPQKQICYLYSLNKSAESKSLDEQDIYIVHGEFMAPKSISTTSVRYLDVHLTL